MYSFHCPSALNHLSQTVCSTRKILRRSRTHTILPWCGLTYYVYYVFLKQVVLGSTFTQHTSLSRSDSSVVTYMQFTWWSQFPWATGKAPRTPLSCSTRMKAPGERHSCQMKQVYLPPCVRFCSTFTALLGHWITLPIITGCTSWIFPAPLSPDAAVVFHSLIRTQNATCCAHQRENRAEKTVQYWSELGRDKKDVLHPVTQALNISFFQHCEIVTIIWNSV